MVCEQAPTEVIAAGVATDAAVATGTVVLVLVFAVAAFTGSYAVGCHHGNLFRMTFVCAGGPIQTVGEPVGIRCACLMLELLLNNVHT